MAEPVLRPNTPVLVVTYGPTHAVRSQDSSATNLPTIDLKTETGMAESSAEKMSGSIAVTYFARPATVIDRHCGTEQIAIKLEKSSFTLSTKEKGFDQITEPCVSKKHLLYEGLELDYVDDSGMSKKVTLLKIQTALKSGMALTVKVKIKQTGEEKDVFVHHLMRCTQTSTVDPVTKKSTLQSECNFLK